MGKVIVFLFDDVENELIPKILDLAGAQQFETQFINLPLRLSFEGLEIRMAQKQVLLDGKEIILTKLEYLVLCHLARHSGWVQSKRQIFEAVWPPETEADYHTVEVAIYTLRKKLDPDTANPRFIKTVPGHGYRFIGKRIT